MSAASRNRVARDLRGTRPISTRIMPDLARPAILSNDESSIRTVGYRPGSKRNRVRYGGSPTEGYTGQWAANPLYFCAIECDSRWSR